MLSGARPRVVSLAPSTTEAMFALGAGDLLVGRSRFCDYPPEALRLPVVGGFSNPNIEAIVALAPTLVIGARGPAGPAIEQALAARSIATFFPETESIEQIESMVGELGRRVGHEAEAAVAVRTIEADRARVHKALSSRPRVRVALLFEISPLVAAGPHSFPDELIREAGGENVVTQGGAYPTLDLERLLALDPDLLLDGASEIHQGEKAPSRLLGMRQIGGFRELRALREGKVASLSVDTVLRPGPRIGQGLITMARAIHGEALVR